MNCLHKNKIAERLFSKFGKSISVLICCLECGNQKKIKDNGRNNSKGNEAI